MITSWQDALDWLYSRANFETRPPGEFPAFELDRIRRVLRALGDPHHRWPAVHVAGTNGKGSTCAMIAAALEAAGYRVGRFTSPHLHTVRERIRIGPRLISEAEVIVWLRRHRATLEAEPGLTTFEALTALAFHHFAARGVDLGVIEVGLGGTLDTTNVVRPAITVLTPIALDHTNVLGDSVDAIARDKAGVIRPGIMVVSAPQPPAAAAVIARAAAERRAPLVRVGADVTWQVTGDGRLVVTIGRDDARRLVLRPALDAPYQRVNAATAVAALDGLDRHGWPVPDAAIAAGLAAARWPGRFEVLSEAPPLVVDGAHNPHAAAALVEALEVRYAGRRRQLIVGASRGKDLDGLLAALLPAFDRVLATQAAHPRALPAADVAAAVARHGRTAESVVPPSAALEAALETAAPQAVTVASGSIFVAAEVRLAWAERSGAALPPRDPPLPIVPSPAST